MTKPEITTQEKLTVYAPLSGAVFPIEDVPDELFSSKQNGDGLSIDPVDSKVVAPFDGEIVKIHPRKHTLTICSPQGILVQIYVGLDTLLLRGKGFTIKVKQGQLVKAGQTLIKFKFNYISQYAKSLLTQIVIHDSDKLKIKKADNYVQAGKDVLMVISPKTRGLKYDSVHQEVQEKPTIYDNHQCPYGKNNQLHLKPGSNEIIHLNELVAALGGRRQIEEVMACAQTRLCVTLKTNKFMNIKLLREIGVRAVVKKSRRTWYLIVGLQALNLAGEFYGIRLCP